MKSASGCKSIEMVPATSSGVVVWGWLGKHYNRIVPASVMIFVIGLSRIYLGVHFPHQVLGGWAVGFVLLMGWFFFGRELKKKE